MAMEKTLAWTRNTLVNKQVEDLASLGLYL